MADTRDFEKIVIPYLDSVYRAAYAICGSLPQAEDLVQATFLKALQRFGSFKPGTNCKAWLLKILRNTWIDELRHAKVVGTTVPANDELLADRPRAQPTSWTDAQDVLENFSDEDVIRALAALPEEQRLTLYLIDVEGLSQEEVARITGVAVGTVKSRASRARAALEGRLEAYARELGIVPRRE
ncbi:MAG: sigma-70 family RNA polymerase sigma factor [Planctomycetota bacterium]|jgi:RNA polymerase sigma-70 factor (ECF subfamily)